MHCGLYMHMCVNACVYKCMCVYECLCILVCMCVYMHVYAILTIVV